MNKNNITGGGFVRSAEMRDKIILAIYTQYAVAFNHGENSHWSSHSKGKPTVGDGHR